MKPTVLVLACFLLIALVGLATAVIPGGKTEETDPHKIRELTKFLEENIKASSPNARIIKVVKVERQVVAGMNYFVTVSVKKGSSVSKVVARIFEPLSRAEGQHPLKLVSMSEQ